MVDLYGVKIDLQTLPVLPAALNKLIEVSSDTDLSNKEIAKIISLDSGITAKILSIANSALFGGVVPIIDLNTAVTRLGRNDVKTVAMTIYISQVLKKFTLSNIVIDKFWKHSLSVAFLARKIINFYDYKNEISEEELNYLYLSALMHDLGYIILDILAPTKFKEFIIHSKNNNISLFQAEQEIFQTSHSEEAAKLFRYWNLPDPIIEIMKHHHRPTLTKPQLRNLSNIIHVADHLTNLFGYEIFEDFPHEPVQSSIYNQFNFLDNSNSEENIFDDLKNQTELFLSFSELALSV